MPLFAFSSNNHFVASSDVTVLHNYELTKSSIHLSSIQKADWKTLATIDTNIKDEDISSKVSNVMSYNRLMFFDGHGRIKGRKALTMLAQHLKELHLLVSPEGYCFQDVSEFGVYSDFGIHYVRLNDFFSCPRHKVELVSISVWSRLELKYNLSKHKNTPKPNVDGGLSKEKYVKLEKTVKAKDEELEKLKEKMKKKDEEEETKARRTEEIEKVNEELEKELEEYQKKLWAIIPGYTKFIPDKLDAKDKYLAMRQSVPPETFACYFEISFPYVSNSHKLVDNLRVDGNYDVTLVEEEISSAEWPPLPTMRVHIGKGGEDFDKNNWWYLKTSHPEGGFTMLVFYDGYRSQISRYGSYPPIPLPFSKDAEFFSYFSMFSLFNVHPFGTKLCFTYR
ncbi:hypothetical protein LINPERHAP2_LOCUS33628 [Linum perenne]